MKHEWTIEQIRNYTKLGFISVAARMVKCTLDHYDKDIESFAEWTAFMQWIYDPTDKCWFQKYSSETKTTAQLREVWEKERKEETE